MAYLRTLPLLTAIHAVLDQSAGELRQIPESRFVPDLQEGAGGDELVRRGIVARAPFRVRATALERHGASPPIGGNLLLYRIRIQVVVSRAIDTAAQLVPSMEIALEALQWEDCDIVRQALETPPNLLADPTPAFTDLAGAHLRWESSDGRVIITDPGGPAQRFETIHDFSGSLKSRPDAVPAPSIDLAPAVSVAGGGPAQDGSTLLATPGDWQHALTFRYQWTRDGVAVAGATGYRYEVTVGDVGASLRIVESAFGFGGAATEESAAIVPA